MPPGFINGTFGYREVYPQTSPISYLLVDSINNYENGQFYLLISAGSGGGNGFMYLSWVIVTFGVPYEVKVPKTP